ncbi:hypothetical protein AMQ83_08070 [Paenibacillus riograndensis]|nr:hypothetical protein AMQ83_08070 [Paenibacillus riograndensis]
MLTVGRRTRGTRVEGECKDNVIGMTEDVRPRICERVYKVAKARSKSGGGSGLGLSLVKKIVDSHDGSITITSRPGEGTACVVVLPMQP